MNHRLKKPSIRERVFKWIFLAGDRFNLKLVAVKIAPREGILTSIFRRNYKIDPSYDPNSNLGEKDVLVLAGKITDIKRFLES
jgi:hypothetical protein